MRLTLRTLLAYLDDTLDAAQVKQIGQKVAESDTAQELIARIKMVTRRRRLTTPPAAGPGSKLDPNTIAEYLENKLSEDQVAEVEQVSLGSDVHLAELSACHQLLTLILGEPILIPPSSRQRMYGLVKGKEAIPFRKPRVESATEEDEKSSEEDYQRDETLRLGLPAWRQRSSVGSRLALIGGTLAACLLLALAIWQALKDPGSPEGLNANQQAGGDLDKNKTGPQAPEAPGLKGPPGTNPEHGSKPGTGKNPPDTGPNPPGGNGKTKPDDKDPKKPGGSDDPKPKPEDPPIKPKDPEPTWKPLPVEEPIKAVLEAGKYDRNLLSTEPEVLLQKVGGLWKQVTVENPKVYSGTMLVSLPGYQSTVSMKGDALQMKLMGALPEETPDALLVRETAVELHQHDTLDLDLTLHRGKFILTNRKDKPAQVRIRFQDPTRPDLSEVWDLLLKEKNTEIFVERWTMIPPGEPFYSDPKHPSRKGPLAAVHLVVREGKVDLHRLDFTNPKQPLAVTYQLQKPPGDARFYWVSITKPDKEKLTKVPDYASDKTEVLEPTLPGDTPPETKKQILEMHKKFLETRQKMKQARKKLMDDLLVNPDKVETVLKSLLKNKSDNYAERILAVRCFGAVDWVEALVDELANKDYIEVRRTAVDTLRRWLSYNRDNDYHLYGKLTANNSFFSSADANSLITMLHGFSAQDALNSPEIYKSLIPKLNDEKLALRELAGLQLYLELPRIFPPGSPVIGAINEIKYSPDAPEKVRIEAVNRWNDLVNAKQLPPKTN